MTPRREPIGPWRISNGQWVRPYREWHPREVCSVRGCWTHVLRWGPKVVV